MYNILCINFNKIILPSCIIILCFLTLSTSAQDCYSERYRKAIFYDVSVYHDIPYGKAVSYKNQSKQIATPYYLDFYEPMGDNLLARPLILMFAGGDFQQGNKKSAEVKTWCDSLARYGYACAAVEYRLGYDKTDKESVERAIYRSVQDARAAIRYFVEHQLTFKIDTAHIFIGGDEAGAITALHTAYMNEEDLRPASSVQTSKEKYNLGCLDCSGNELEHQVKVAGVINLRGELTPGMLANAKAKIPVVHIKEEIPTTLPQNDNPLSFLKMQGTDMLHKDMQAKGIYNELIVAPTALRSTSFQEDFIENPTIQLWNVIWKDVQVFLYNTLTFESMEPDGSVFACAGKEEIYTMPDKEGGSYCWEVIGGRVIRNKGHEISVIWNFGIDNGKIIVMEMNPMQIVGKPAVLNVELRATPEAEFSVNKIKDNVVMIADESAYGTFYTLDFGDGSLPYNGRMGSSTEHTYMQSGDYKITQIIENICGVAMSTRVINVDAVAQKKADLERISIYPNPATKSDEVNINILSKHTSEDIKILIKDSFGDIIVSQEIKDVQTTSISLNTEVLSSGTYQIQIEIGDEISKQTLKIE